MVKDFEGKFVTLIDASESVWINAGARVALGKGLGEFERNNLSRYEKSLMVIPKLHLRVMLKGLNLFLKPVVEQDVTSTFEQAHEKAKEVVLSMNS